jgi:acetyl esterase/lipase
MINKVLIFLQFFLFIAVSASAQKSFEVKIQSNTIGNTNELTKPEVTDRDGKIYNVSKSTITVFSPSAKKNTRMAVLICPGGVYDMISSKKEGSDFAKWLANNGITGIVLKYRLPNHHPNIPLEDAQKAMQIIRKNALLWKINPQKIGVMGFSAGGHLASTLLTHFDSISRPAFGILFYPVITFSPRLTHTGTMNNFFGTKNTKDLINYYSNERQVKPNTPPTLLFHSSDDELVSSQHTLLFYNALKEYKIFASVQMFPSSSHGWGFDPNYPYHEFMKETVLDWIESFR